MTRARDVASQGGLVLISSTTVGTAVTSVTVNNAFSATYENYRILWTGGSVSTALSIQMTLSGIGSVYENSVIRGNSRSNTVSNGSTGGSAASWQVGGNITANPGIVLELQVFQPFLAKSTVFRGFNSGFGVNNEQEVNGGVAYALVSSTGFTFTAGNGNFTGGTISVYGYKK
jgi:hypothetical protein